MHLLLVFLLAAIASAASPAEWRSRTIYQLLTDRFALANGSTTNPCNTSDRRYCGGSFNGVINQLDYIQGMGFTAVWISPVVKNIEGWTGWGEAFHGYWASDIDTLNPHFGTPQELRDLSDALHTRGMYLMVDVVPNHFGHPGTDVDFRKFAAPFDTADAFHDFCWITDYNDQNMVENCWLGDDRVALADVNTSEPWVQKKMNDWVRDLVDTFKIDGLRIDTAKHMGKSFLSSFTDAAGVFTTGEVYHADLTYTCPYQAHVNGLLNYPLFYPLTRAFQSPSNTMYELLFAIGAIRINCADPTLLSTFSENHDQPRFPSLTPDLSLAKNIITFTLISDGIPVIYAGQEQHFSSTNDPHNREAIWLSGFSQNSPMYVLIGKINRLRNFLPPTHFAVPAKVLTGRAHMFAYRKGEVVAVFSNEGKISGERILAVPGTGWKEGEWAVDVLSGYLVRVGKGGRVRVRVRNGEPRVLVALKGLEGSGIAAGVVAPAELKGVVGMVLGWIAGWRWAFLAGIAEKAMLRKR